MEKYKFLHVLVEKLQISFNLIGCLLCYVKNLIGCIVFMYVKKDFATMTYKYFACTYSTLKNSFWWHHVSVLVCRPILSNVYRYFNNPSMFR